MSGSSFGTGIGSGEEEDGPASRAARDVEEERDPPLEPDPELEHAATRTAATTAANSGRRKRLTRRSPVGGERAGRAGPVIVAAVGPEAIDRESPDLPSDAERNDIRRG